jgi:hypothetical protein
MASTVRVTVHGHDQQAADLARGVAPGGDLRPHPTLLAIGQRDGHPIVLDALAGQAMFVDGRPALGVGIGLVEVAAGDVGLPALLAPAGAGPYDPHLAVGHAHGHRGGLDEIGQHPRGLGGLAGDLGQIALGAVLAAFVGGDGGQVDQTGGQGGVVGAWTGVDHADHADPAAVGQADGRAGEEPVGLRALHMGMVGEAGVGLGVLDPEHLVALDGDGGEGFPHRHVMAPAGPARAGAPGPLGPGQHDVAVEFRIGAHQPPDAIEHGAEFA